MSTSLEQLKNKIVALDNQYRNIWEEKSLPLTEEDNDAIQFNLNLDKSIKKFRLEIPHVGLYDSSSISISCLDKNGKEIFNTLYIANDNGYHSEYNILIEAEIIYLFNEDKKVLYINNIIKQTNNNGSSSSVGFANMKQPFSLCLENETEHLSDVYNIQINCINSSYIVGDYLDPIKIAYVPQVRSV